MSQQNKKEYEIKFIRDLAFKLERSSGCAMAINYLLDVIEMLLKERK